MAKRKDDTEKMIVKLVHKDWPYAAISQALEISESVIREVVKAHRAKRKEKKAKAAA
jgi:DNA-directed RNA polymerase specialized sigma24 family protein